MKQPGLKMTAHRMLCALAACLALSTGTSLANDDNQGTEHKVDTWETIRIRTLENGNIESIHIQKGNHVSQGSPLVTLDHFNQKHQLETAIIRANDTSRLDSARTNFELREAILEDTRAKARRRNASELDVLQAQAQADNARSNVEAAEAADELAKLSVKAAEHNYRQRFISSPTAGVVKEVHVEPGQSVRSGEVLITLAESTSWRTVTAVPAEFASHVKTGMQIPATLADGTKQRAEIVKLIPGKNGQMMAEMQVRNDDSRKLPDTENVQFQFPSPPSSS